MKCLIVLVVVILQAHAANILLLFPIPSPSYKTPIKVLMEGLIARGHHITLVSPYSLKENLDNCTEIILHDAERFRERSMKPMMNFNISSFQAIRLMLESDEIVRITLDNAEVKELLKSKHIFDVIVQQLTLSEALLGVGHHLKVPTIVFNTLGTLPNIDKITGNSHPYAYVPYVHLPITDEMTFSDRLKNLILSLLIDTINVLLSEPVQNKVLHEYFPNAPHISTLAKNVSVVLLNGHYSIVETPRPYMPNMIPIGGFHVQTQPLPQDLKTYMDESAHGVVLFSLGSNFPSAELSKEKLKVIFDSLAAFPQRFLWKFEDNTLEVPQNVLIRKWMPQTAILSHPNTKAFISHGGLFSVTEAVYYAVPLIGIPLFADQHYNIANAVHKKFALKYDFGNLTKETFTAVIKEALENPVYTENIALRSSILRNQPVPPLNLALYWIEHVAKHVGAPHIQSAGAKLGWVQAYLVDVLFFIVVVTTSLAYLCYKIVKILIRCLCGRRKYKRE